MKVKRVNEVVVRMAPWEVDQLRAEIAKVLAAYQRDSGAVYPLALHDFHEKLSEVL